MTGYSGICHLNFLSNSHDLNKTFRRVTFSEDDIARQQIEEDLRLYASRPEPPDMVEVDESTHLANSPPKRNASEIEAAADPSARMRKKGESKEFNYQAVTAMDWNSGASPLDAWLNQSAVPSTTEALNQRGPMKPTNDLLAQEMEEIKVFRNVHVATAPSLERNDPPLEPIEGLEFDFQIYYRNIMDRYPVIPVYLARRLAHANHDRAERLREMKVAQPKLVFNHDVSRPHWSERPLSDFWTGGSQSSRPASAHSRSSSMNSSLHGRPAFDPQEQNPTFASKYPAPTAYDTPNPPALPPPPVELGTVTTFNCDICGQNVQAKRRLEWQ